MSNAQFGVVTGASSGIGLELAKCCARNGFDLVIAADERQINDAARTIESLGAQCTPVECDLATLEGVDRLCTAIEKSGRPVDALLANAGRGLGRGFLDQSIAEALKVVHTNIDGTIYLIHRIGRDMRARGRGRILITGSIAGYMPGSFQAVYNGTKAFLDSFSVALYDELKDTGVTVTCLMPGPTDTKFFERADLMDTDVGTDESKADPADVAKTGFEAMMQGEVSVVHGFKNKMEALASGVMPETALAKMHRGMAQPGTAKQ